MKTRIQLAGFTALLAAAAASVQAEVKINDNLSLDGFGIGSGIITHGTAASNDVVLGKSGNSDFDSLFVGVTGKYDDIKARASFLAANPFDNTAGDSSGIVEAYLTYTADAFSFTAGKYLGYLGYESFFSPNNAFISFSGDAYASPFSTGVKADYAGEGFSLGVSARDSQIAGGSGFLTGDGEFSDDIGYETYISITSIEDLTLFAGLGYEDLDGGDPVLTANFWASYNVSDKLTLAGEYATLEDSSDSSWLALASYKVSDELSVAGRVTYFNGIRAGADTRGYGVASTYTFTPNFSLKAEITKKDTTAPGFDPMQYALQGLFRF
jgi:hypothetical protein